MLAFVKARGWQGLVFATCASARASEKYLAMSPSSAVHGGQFDTKLCDIRVDIASGSIRG